jgi:glycosyltransferase involved in cell wall biosynthesis
MKILEVNKFNYVRGGADRHFLDVTRLLKSSGHEVATFSMDSPAGESRNLFSPWQKYFVSYVGYNKNDSTLTQKIKGTFRMFYSFEARGKMKRLLADFEPDVVHIHNIYHQISPSILTIIKQKKIPIVMTVHDYKLVCPDYLLRDWKPLGKYRYLKFIFGKKFKNSYFKSLLVALEFLWHKYWKSYAKNIDLYICPSLFLKNKLVAHGISEKKIIVLPHFFLPAEKNSEVKNTATEKYALYFGKIAEDKNISELLEIFEKNRNIKLYLAGELEAGFEIKKHAQLKYLGALGKIELKKYIQNAQFVVSSSKLPETFGLIALEALSLGKPFVGYDTGAFSEIVENNKTGFLCQNATEFGEKIEQLTQDEKLRKMLSQNAYVRAADFAAKKYLKEITLVFGELTDKPKNGSI